MSKRKKTIRSGIEQPKQGRVVVRPQLPTQMYNIQVDYHLLRIIQLIVSNQKMRDGVDKLIRNL